MKRFKLSFFIQFIMAAPAVIVGSIAMRVNGVPVHIFGQNLVFLMIAGLISFLVLGRKNVFKENNLNLIVTLIAITLLLLTFIHKGIEGVHRYLSLGPIQLNANFIVLPVLIIELRKLLQIKKWWIPALMTIVISILLALQPDASQLTAFSIAMIILLWNKKVNNIFYLLVTGLLSGLVIFSWIFIDSLPPVSYVEKIVGLVSHMGFGWLVLGVLTLIMLPLPFLLFPPKNSKQLSICIGIYYIIVLVSTLFGNFPVPLMGYGVSPICGYFISITWYAKHRTILNNQVR